MQLVTDCGHRTQREDEGTYTHSPLETKHSHSDNSNTLKYVGGKKKKTPPHTTLENKIH